MLAAIVQLPSGGIDGSSGRVREELSPRGRQGNTDRSITMDIELVAREVVDSAMKVHTVLGPGLLESAYKACLVYELRSED